MGVPPSTPTPSPSLPHALTPRSHPLTLTDSDALFAMVSPMGGPMCLTATPDGRWQYAPPPRAVPPDTPEPTAAINLAAGHHHHHMTDWLAYAAAHSDAWLLAQSVHAGVRRRLDAGGRDALFDAINRLPTLYEEVRAWTRPGGGGGRPAGTTEPPPPGPRLARAEFTRALRGRVASIYHPEDDRWYTATFTRVAPTAGTADVRLVLGGTEVVDVPDLISRGHIVMIT